MGLERQGFVGLFLEPLSRSHISNIIDLWIERFGSVEQALGRGGQVLTTVLKSSSDIAWQDNMELRVLNGEQFTWVYLSEDKYVIETSGLVPERGASSLCRDVLADLEGCAEIIDDRNDRRLDDLEAQGKM
jgi:hypothetical protein